MRLTTAFIFVVSIAGAVGCSKPQPEFGDKPEDWKQTAPPAGWKGPGQPGGPAAGAGGPGVTPPAGK